MNPDNRIPIGNRHDRRAATVTAESRDPSCQTAWRGAIGRGRLGLIALVFAALLFGGAAQRLQAAGDNHRMILLTDLLGEPDDSQMIVRLLMYANEMDIEGLIAVSISDPGYPARNPSQPHRIGVHPEELLKAIDAYAVVRPNLLKHAPGWPTAAELTSKVGAGPYGYGMAAVGDGQSTPGTRLIVQAVEKPDPRPVYICVTGGANPLAQALWDYRKAHTPEQVKAFVAKLRVYDDFGQDDAGAWICHNFPDILWIRSLDQAFGLMGPGPPHIPPGVSPTARDPYVWQPYPPTDEGQHLWMKEHVQHNHGPLGALYPDRTERNGRFRYLEGGNTSTWIGLVNKGLYDPEHIAWGGWGGRFQDRKMQIPAGQTRVHSYGEGEKPFEPFAMYPDATDKWTDPETGRTYDDVWTPIRRWRRAYQNDFQARMEWCVKEFKDVNHNPIAAFNGDLSRTIVRLTASPGGQLTLDASGSTDPDHDALSFRWFPYPEAGTYRGEVAILHRDESRAQLVIPANAAGTQIHVVLEVRDQNPVVPLFGYRRIVVDVK
jgi:hypothetical protein